MKFLLHICCARCAIYPVKKLKSNYELIGYYFNPNIQPATEYLLRGESLLDYAKSEDMELLIGEYTPYTHLKSTINQLENRCEICYTIRLTETAKKARELGCYYFSTTLLSSPYQNHFKIKEIGERIAEDLGDIEFYYEDFRVGWKEAQKIADEMNIYKQKYCGCLFSEYERFQKKVKRFTSLG